MNNIVKKLQQINSFITKAIVVLLVFGLSFYFENAYFNIDDAKWNFFSLVSLGRLTKESFIPGILLIACVIEIVILFIRKIHLKEKIRISRFDKLISLYLLTAVVSSFFAYDKWTSIVGYDGWYMGLIAQLDFVLIYYFVSRYFELKKEYVFILLSVTAVVFVLEILNRFNIIIPSLFAQNVKEGALYIFVSTIGNINWFASYTAVCMPVAFVLFVISEDKEIKIISTLSVIVSSLAFVTQNSQSLIFAFITMLIFLLFFSMRKELWIRKYSLLLIIIFSSFLLIGLLREFVIKDHVVLDDVFEIIMNFRFVSIVLLLSVLFRYFVCKVIDDKNISQYRKIALHTVLMLSLVFIAFVILNNTSVIPDNFKLKMFVFNDSWGNGRGELWRLTITTLKRMFKTERFRIIFGSGADSYKFALFKFCYEEAKINWLDKVPTNAHNEWLTPFVNYGVVGGLSYLLMFFERMHVSYRNSKENAYFFVFFLMIYCYFLNNFFSFQQVVSTPFVFIVFGLINCLKKI